MCASYDCIAILHFSTMNSSNDDKSVLSTESSCFYISVF